MYGHLPECFQGLQHFEKDRLLPRESAIFVTENPSGHIELNKGAISEVSHWMLSKLRNNEDVKYLDFSAHELHPKTYNQTAVDWVFLIDTINFSFWTEDEAKFRVTYKGTTYTGYFAACACVNRAIESGIKLTDANCLMNITEEEVKKIFQADNGDLMPLCDLRAKVMAEAGRVLLKKFNGSFYNCLKMCGRSAMKLLAIVVENFESYRDYATYKGQKICFLKRAQILVADIYGCLRDKNDLANFDDIESLTMFADYRVPQVLAFWKVLKYSPELISKLKSKVLMENGSTTEVEIRAFSIRAIDEIVREIEKLRTESDGNLRKITAVAVDNFLWYQRRMFAKEIEKDIDYHRVRAIYY